MMMRGMVRKRKDTTSRQIIVDADTISKRRYIGGGGWRSDGCKWREIMSCYDGVIV